MQAQFVEFIGGALFPARPSPDIDNLGGSSIR
jgi:hypothetical protein